MHFFQTGKNMGKSFDCGMAIPSLTWWSVFQVEVGSICSLSQLLDISFDVLRFSHLLGLWCILDGLPNLLLLEVAFFLFFLLASGLQSFSSPYTRSSSCTLTSPAPFHPRSLPTHLWRLSCLSQVGLRGPHLGPSGCWPFWVLWTVCVYTCACTCACAFGILCDTVIMGGFTPEIYLSQERYCPVCCSMASSQWVIPCSLLVYFWVFNYIPLSCLPACLCTNTMWFLSLLLCSRAWGQRW